MFKTTKQGDKSRTILVFLFQLTIISIALSGMDIFFNPSHSNKTGIPTFLRFNNLSFLLMLVMSLIIALNEGIPKLRAIQISVLIFSSTFLMSFFQTEDPLNVIKNLMLNGRGILIFLMFSFLIANMENVNKMINAFIWLGILSTPIALFQEYQFLSIGKLPFTDSIITRIQGISFLRVQSFMSECNFLAFCLGFSFLLLIGNANKITSKRWITHTLMFLIGVALFFTFCRSVILAIIIALFLSAKDRAVPIFKNKFISSIMIIGALIFSILAFYVRGYNAIHSRLLLLKESTLIFLKNPFFGIGIGNISQQTSEKTGAHNQFLDIATSSGIFSLIIYMLFLYWIYRELKDIKQMNTALGQTLMSCFIYMLVVFMFEGLMSNIVPWIVFGLIDLAYRTVKLQNESYSYHHAS